MRFAIVLALAVLALAAPATAATITITGCDSDTLNNVTIVDELNLCLDDLASNVTTCPDACPMPLEEVRSALHLLSRAWRSTHQDELRFTIP